MQSTNTISAKQTEKTWSKSQGVSRDYQSATPAVITRTTYRHDRGLYELTLVVKRNRADSLPNEILTAHVDSKPFFINELSKLKSPSNCNININSSRAAFILHPKKNPDDIEVFNTMMQMFIESHYLENTNMLSDIRASCFIDDGNMDNDTVVHLINSQSTMLAAQFVMELQKKRDFELVWFLVRCLHEEFIMKQPLDLESIIYVFGKLTEDNPYFESARDILLKMVKLTQLEQQFVRAYYSGNHELSNRYYNQMCGYPENSEYFKAFIDNDKIIRILNYARMKKYPKPTDHEVNQVSEQPVVHDELKKKTSKYFPNFHMWHKDSDKNMTTDVQQARSNISNII